MLGVVMCENSDQPCFVKTLFCRLAAGLQSSRSWLNLKGRVLAVSRSAYSLEPCSQYVLALSSSTVSSGNAALHRLGTQYSRAVQTKCSKIKGHIEILYWSSFSRWWNKHNNYSLRRWAAYTVVLHHVVLFTPLQLLDRVSFAIIFFTLRYTKY